MKQHTVIDSPYGPLTLVADDDGVLSGLYMTEQRHRPAEETLGDRDDTPFAAAREQLSAYFAGALKEFTLPLRPHGTPFQRRVWDELRRSAAGGTSSYGRLAAARGSPAAPRAVSLASGRTTIGIVIPCHRVIGASGSRPGYGGGLEGEQRLLDFERGAGLFWPAGPL